MGEAYAIPAVLAHVHLVAPNLRPGDKAEVIAEGLRPAKVLRHLLRMSDFANTLLLDGEVAGMFGVLVRSDGVAVPWVLTTSAVDRHPVAFWKASKYAVGKMAERYPALVQCIDARYEKALRWVKRLGFQVEEAPHPCGPNQMLFFRATYSARG